MKQLNDQNFKDGISKGIVVVDMYADWCGPCRALSPLLEQLEGEYADVTFVKFDVDASPEVPREYNVMGIPAVFIFKDGQLVQRIDGFDASRGKTPYTSVIDELRRN